MKSKAFVTSDTKFDIPPQTFTYTEDGGRDSKKTNEAQTEEESAPAEYEEAIEKCGFGKFHYLILLAMLPVSMAQLFTSGTLSFVIPSAECDLKLTDMDKGVLNAGVYAGTIASGFFMGFVADVVGRRRVIVVAFLMDFIFNTLSTLAPNFWVLLVLKICCGLIITGASAANFAYLAETFGIKHRPMAIMVTGIFSASGQIVQPALAYFVIPMTFRIELIPGILDLTSWRVFIFICALPSLISAIVYYCAPESPKYLMSSGRTAEALEAFKRIYATNTGMPPDTFPVKQLKAPVRKELEEGQADGAPCKKSFWAIVRDGWSQVRPIFSPPYLNVALLVFSVEVCVVVSFNSLRLWIPQLFASLDAATKLAANSSSELPGGNTICDLLASVKVSNNEEIAQTEGVCNVVPGIVYLRSVVIGVTATIIFIISTQIIGYVGRKNMTRYSFPIPAILAVGMNWATSSNIFMALVAFYYSFVENGNTALTTRTVDLFPTAFRTTAIGLQTLCGRVSSLIANILFPVILNMNCSAVFFILAGLLTLVSVLVWLIPDRVEKN